MSRNPRALARTASDTRRAAGWRAPAGTERRRGGRRRRPAGPRGMAVGPPTQAARLSGDAAGHGPHLRLEHPADVIRLAADGQEPRAAQRGVDHAGGTATRAWRSRQRPTPSQAWPMPASNDVLRASSATGPAALGCSRSRSGVRKPRSRTRTVPVVAVCTKAPTAWGKTRALPISIRCCLPRFRPAPSREGRPTARATLGAAAAGGSRGAASPPPGRWGPLIRLSRRARRAR